MHGHCKRITLGSTYLEKECVIVNKELGWGSVCVDQDGREEWADSANVVEGYLSVQGTESIACID